MWTNCYRRKGKRGRGERSVMSVANQCVQKMRPVFSTKKIFESLNLETMPYKNFFLHLVFFYFSMCAQWTNLPIQVVFVFFSSSFFFSSGKFPTISAEFLLNSLRSQFCFVGKIIMTLRTKKEYTLHGILFFFFFFNFHLFISLPIDQAMHSDKVKFDTWTVFFGKLSNENRGRGMCSGKTYSQASD